MFCVPRIYLTEYTDCVLIVIWGFIMHKSKCTCVWTKVRLECIYIFPIKIYKFYKQRYHNIHVLLYLHLHWDQASAFHLKSFHYSLFVLFRSLKWGSVVYVNFRWTYFGQIFWQIILSRLPHNFCILVVMLVYFCYDLISYLHVFNIWYLFITKN